MTLTKLKSKWTTGLRLHAAHAENNNFGKILDKYVFCACDVQYMELQTRDYLFL